VDEAEPLRGEDVVADGLASSDAVEDAAAVAAVAAAAGSIASAGMLMAAELGNATVHEQLMAAYPGGQGMLAVLTHAVAASMWQPQCAVLCCSLVDESACLYMQPTFRAR
jgi:hypothetical protein